MEDEKVEERFVELEMIAADHERILKDLNQIVAEQARTIDLLVRQVRCLAENYDAGGQVKPLSEETRPPHY